MLVQVLATARSTCFAAFAVFGAAGAFAWLAFGRSSTTVMKNPVLSSSPISVSALDRRGQIRCTATFPADQVAPGAQAGVAFTVENLSDHQIEIPEGAGNGATGYLVERSADGTLLQDTSSPHSGTIGGYPMPRPVAPGVTFDLPAYDAPLLWPGTIEITPMCPIGRDPKGIMLPDVQIIVATSGSAPNSGEAVTSAVHAVSPDFDDCAPQDTADEVVGSVHGYAALRRELVRGRGSIHPVRSADGSILSPRSEAQRSPKSSDTRMNSMIQFVSNVRPSSNEKNCSQRAEDVVMSFQSNRILAAARREGRHTRTG